MRLKARLHGLVRILGMIEMGSVLLEAGLVVMDTIGLLEAGLIVVDAIVWLWRSVLRRGRRYGLGLMLHTDAILGRVGYFCVGSRSGSCSPPGASPGPDEVGNCD